MSEVLYHRNRGLEKLTDDRRVEHIFIARSKDYMNVEVWLLERSNMISTFDRWLPELIQNYETAERQRFRRSVSYGFVTSQGIRLLVIIDENPSDFLELTWRKDSKHCQLSKL